MSLQFHMGDQSFETRHSFEFSFEDKKNVIQKGEKLPVLAVI